MRIRKSKSGQTRTASYSTRPLKDGRRTDHLVVGRSKAAVRGELGKLISGHLRAGEAVEWNDGAVKVWHRTVPPAKTDRWTRTVRVTEARGGRRVESPGARYKNPFFAPGLAAKKAGSKPRQRRRSR